MEHPRDREAVEQAVARGSELLKQGRIDQALLAFRDALALDPDNPRVLALLGLSQFRAGAFGEARAVYEQLVERAPTDAAHRLNLGLVYLKLGDAERAIAALEASRALDPSQGRAVSYLGLAYARAGRYAEAYRAFLLAGQNDLASEIESNLTAAERDRILQQLGRAPEIERTLTPSHGVPRTKPPSAPPAKSRTPSYPGIPESELPRAPSGPVSAAPASVALHSAEDNIYQAVADAPAAPPEPVRPQAAAPSVEGDARPEPRPAAPPEPPAPSVARTVTPGGTVRLTESMQFVRPRPEPPDPAAPNRGFDGHSMISYAVASATPTPAAAVRTRGGGTPPRPLSDLATDDLVRPDDGDDVFEIGPGGALIVRIDERVMTRLDGVHITGGDLAYEVAMRRSRGHNTDEAFNHGGSQLHAVSGRGYLIALPGKAAFAAVSLDDDILYLREDLVFAFEASLRWENGNVPGLRGKLPIVQFRGDGAVALRLARPLVRVKLPAQGMVFVDADRLAGWIGRVIPRAVVPPPGGPLGAMCVECTGEGIVLVEPAPGPVAAAEPRRRAPSSPAPTAEPPQAAAAAAASDLAEGTSPDVRIGAPGDWHGDSPGDWHGDSPVAPPLPSRPRDPLDEL